MSYKTHNAVYAPVCGIHDLNFDEIEQVNGGRLSVIVKVISWVIGAELTSSAPQPD